MLSRWPTIRFPFAKSHVLRRRLGAESLVAFRKRLFRPICLPCGSPRNKTELSGQGIEQVEYLRAQNPQVFASSAVILLSSTTKGDHLSDKSFANHFLAVVKAG